MANRAIRQFRDVRYASLGLTETKFIMLNYRWIFEEFKHFLRMLDTIPWI